MLEGAPFLGCAAKLGTPKKGIPAHFEGPSQAGAGLLPSPKSLFLLLILPLALACSLSIRPPATPTPIPPSPTPSPTVMPAAPQLGTSKAPLILALPPSPRVSEQVQSAGEALVGMLEKSTGYAIVPVVPPSETDLVAGFSNGNAHIGVLSPYAYLIASGAGNAEAAFARQHHEAIFYGAQFVAHAEAGFVSYFDPLNGGNTAEAAAALAQFEGKKPCWTDTRSPSGYVVPLGYLKLQNIRTLDPAFLAGHAAVVRAVDVGGICDFGATYVDARTYPGLQDQFPDLLRQVDVIWRVPPIIPYETLVFVRGMDDGMRRALIRAFVDLENTPEGQAAMQTLYGFDAMQVVQDSQYEEFRRIVRASGLDLSQLIR